MSWGWCLLEAPGEGWLPPLFWRLKVPQSSFVAPRHITSPCFPCLPLLWSNLCLPPFYKAHPDNLGSAPTQDPPLPCLFTVLQRPGIKTNASQGQFSAHHSDTMSPGGNAAYKDWRWPEKDLETQMTAFSSCCAGWDPAQGLVPVMLSEPDMTLHEAPGVGQWCLRPHQQEPCWHPIYYPSSSNSFDP